MYHNLGPQTPPGENYCDNHGNIVGHPSLPRTLV
jgi:hypothetical protein